MTLGDARSERLAQILNSAAAALLRLGLIVPLLWIGIQKFTAAEAHGIEPLIRHQPAMSWLYQVMSVQAFSDVLGGVEIVAAILIAIKPLSTTASAVGSIIAVGLFVSTTSFLITTPGVVAPSPLHIPLLTADGAFLIKDIALLGAALWTLADALHAHEYRRRFASDTRAA